MPAKSLAAAPSSPAASPPNSSVRTAALSPSPSELRAMLPSRASLAGARAGGVLPSLLGP
eukprot:scaffold17_cov302-Prasinococcus_capsulatus_cf.AAC.2